MTMLYPLWGLIPEPRGDKDEGRFDDYSRVGGDYFSLVPSLSESDVAVLPYEWRSKHQWKSNYYKYVDEANEFANEASKFNKRLIIFFNNDSDEAVPVNNSIIFRTSFYRCGRNRYEFAIPGWSVDFLSRYLGGTLKIRKKSTSPTVGYCGYIDNGFIFNNRIIMKALDKFPLYRTNVGACLRGKAVRELQREKNIKTNFIIRKGFSGLLDGEIRKEYVENIVDSDYLLVTRGSGNFSYRLYEVLSCGRLPIFIDTDCVLPFDHIIDWKKYCIWVDSKDIESIGEKVLEFHNNINEKDFLEIQYSVRVFYEKYICPIGFYSNLWRCIV